MNTTKCKIIIGAALLNLMQAFFIIGQTANVNGIYSLPANKIVERQLSGGDTQSFKIRVKADEFLQIKVERKGIDVIVKLVNANQKLLQEANALNSTLGFENLIWIAKEASELEIQIVSKDKQAPRGIYSIFWTTRTPTENDRKAVKAEILFGEALQALGNESTAEIKKASIPQFEEARRIYQEIGDKSGEAATFSNTGTVYYFLGEYQKALDSYNQALTLFKTIPDKSGEVRTLIDLGRTYYRQGENRKARDYYNQALPNLGIVGDKETEIGTLFLIGLIYYDTGEYQEALDTFNRVLPLLRAIGSKPGEGAALNSIGAAYTDLGEKIKALDYYNQALPIRLQADQPGAVITLINLGNLYLSLKEKQKPFDYYNQALALTIKLGDKNGEAKTRSKIGDAYAQLGEKQKALDTYNQALEIIRAGSGGKRWEAITLSSLGKFYADSGEKQKAIEYYNQALPIHREVGDRSQEAATLDKLRDAWSSSGNQTLAIIYGKQAVNKYQELRQLIQKLNKETQKSYRATVEPAYRALADLLISEGRFPEAQAVLDLLKEEEFKNVAPRRSGEPINTLPYSSAEEEAIKIVDRLAVLGRELSDLKAKPKNALSADETTRLNSLEQTEIPAANKALRLATEALAKVAPDVKNALDAKIKDNVQTILPALGKGVVALYTVVGKTVADDAGENKTSGSNRINVGWILLVTPEIRKAYPIDTKDLEQIVFKFREALRSPDYDPQPFAAELYKKMFLQTSAKQKTTLEADLEETLREYKDKTLMWSLDGVLRYVPMAALYDGKGYLVEKYRNVVFNTASLGSLKDQPKASWEVVGLGVSTEGTGKFANGKPFHFLALKGSESELNAIVKELDRADDNGIFSGTLRMNRKFDKQALFDGARAGMPVMHISSHFYFDVAQEENSFLLLGDGKRLDITEFEDYPNLFSDIDFLSLSACDTATSGNAYSSNSTATEEKAASEQKAREANGKEIESFAFAAQRHGAKSVMASLWRVSDQGTKELMLKFYQIKKEQLELPKGEALRQAQLSLLRGTDTAQTAGDGEKGVEEQTKKLVEGLKPFKKDEKAPFAHPYYWSSFILIGNWK